MHAKGDKVNIVHDSGARTECMKLRPSYDDG